MTPPEIRGISSMATRQVLADLGAGFAQQSGTQAAIESVGGVDAAKRVAAGEAFDVVILASDAIDKLLAAGHLLPGSKALGGDGETVTRPDQIGAALDRAFDALKQRWPRARTLAVVVRKDKRLHRGLRETVAALKALQPARGKVRQGDAE